MMTQEHLKTQPVSQEALVEFCRVRDQGVSFEYLTFDFALLCSDLRQATSVNETNNGRVGESVPKMHHRDVAQ